MAENSQSRTARRKQKKNKNKPLWKRIIFTIFIVLLAIGIASAGLVTYWIATAPEIDASMLTDPFPSQVLDEDGNQFASLGAEQRSRVEYEELPDVLVDAVTATEDARFFEHPGIDLRRIGGAVIANVTSGFGSEGASTITQQVVEKSFLSPDKKISLKVQEQWLALKLEREYSKEEILEMYLNKIYYGAGAYGVGKAAEIYFGKTDLGELTLPEAAILAGLPQRPSAYNPFENPDLMKERMNTVLTLMVRHGKISEQEAEEARKVDIPSLLTDTRRDPVAYEAFLQQVEKEVSEKIDGANIHTDGLKIHTTLDKEAQEHVEYLLSDESPVTFPNEDIQAGMTVLDTSTGAIKAVGGARGGLENGGLNYAINVGHQPGSAIKPIAAYGPAIEYNNWSTYHQILDEPYSKGDWSPQNFDGQFHGWVSAREALTMSYNIPALKTIEEVGVGNAAEFAEKLGITLESRNVGEAIGGTETEVSPLQLAGAFRAFGNEGIYNEPYAVTKVEFPDGETVEFETKPEAVMDDSTAYMITDMLQSVMTEGTGTSANVPGLHVAGKTGTTNLEGGAAGDAWFSGYTTNYTMAVWTGYPDNEPLEDTSLSRQLFKLAMEEISADIDTPDFEKPDSVVEVAVEKGSNPAKLPSPYTPSSQIVTELFVKGTEPSNTSEKFDQLDPISDLNAAFNEETNSIDISWSYNTGSNVEFEVSASEDGGQMQVLSSTSDTSMSISDVEPGTEYEIQVVAVDGSDSSNRSEARSTTVIAAGTDDEQEDNENGNIGSVSGLSGTYNAANQLIDVSWDYNGPPATFEVNANGQTQTVTGNGIEISGVQPGETYSITVTPIGQNGANEGVRGEPQSTEVSVPQPETDGGGDNENAPDNRQEPAEDESGNGNNNENENGNDNGPPEDEGSDEASENDESGNSNGGGTTEEESESETQNQSGNSNNEENSDSSTQNESEPSENNEDN
ncbi:PBP1A family penicillin-binding protein [Virgibacillus xinjiangensis]|uniref:PBP1A family penicillin-binding protein n=1 Tax=Virgibacillus xinjiangensis TaxID=393090 RepID=A0ABV7CR59_9BACI